MNTTINHTIVEAQALRQAPPARAGGVDAEKRQQSFLRTIDWIVAGVRQEALCDDHRPAPLTDGCIACPRHLENDVV